ncbi:hypothetical protein BDF21DRAFT_328333, partial [Thamnidium elegans]
DTAIGEFSKSVEESKFYKNKLKSLLACKLNLNSSLKDAEKLNLNLNTVKISSPFVIVMGLDAAVYNVTLSSGGLYVLHK